MTNKPLDHETIARAMKEAAWIAKHGTREQRAGRFIPPHGSKAANGARHESATSTARSSNAG